MSHEHLTVKAIFHAPASAYALLKEKGFTHVEIARQAWPGNYEAMHTAMKEAHALGLGCIVEIGLEKWAEEAFIFMRTAPWDVEKDFLMLPDEANLRGFPPNDVKKWVNTVKTWTNLRTLCTLDGTKPILQYANCADVLAIDFYGRIYDLWRTIPLALRINALRLKHKGEVWGIPGVKNSAREIRLWKNWWNLIGIKNLYWYSWTPDQENPKWAPVELSQMPEWLEAMR